MSTYPITSQDEYDKFVAKLKKTLDFRGGVMVSVENIKSRRTLAQNALMWVWNHAIAKHFNSHPDDVHAALKTIFLPLDIELFGEKITIVNTTQGLSVEAFTEYLRKMELFMMERGVPIPASPHYENSMKERN